jgi:RpiR family transcriptional regulator, carbohydrate utilization regulator
MNSLLQLLGREDVRLRRSERLVAEAVMADPAATVHRTLAELAAQARVSEPTVIRFCRAFGFRGFRDFRIRFAQAVAAQGSMDGAAMTPVDPGDVIGSVLANHVRALTRVRNTLDKDAVQRAVVLLAEARRIEFFGVGASGVVALDAQQKFFRLGLPTLAYVDSHMQIMSAATLRPGDAVVAISHTGRTKDILESAMTARDGGADVLAITSPDSPLSLAATLTLPVDTVEDTDLFTPMMSRLAHLAVVDVLATGIALRGGRVVDENMRRLKARLQVKRLPKNSGRIIEWPADPSEPDDEAGGA